MSKTVELAGEGERERYDGGRVGRTDGRKGMNVL